MAETWAEEVARLRREIAERESRLRLLVLGDQRVRVTMLSTCPVDHSRLAPGATCLGCGVHMLEDL